VASKARLLPRSEVVAERSSPLGLLTVVRSPEVPFRFAPGLSLEHLQPLPEQLAVFTDGDSMTVVDRSTGPGDEPAYLEDLPSALPYHLLDSPAVLVLGAGGGSEIASALRHGARSIDAVEYDPRMRELLEGELAEFSGGLYRRPGVNLHTDEARSFIGGADGRFDLIQISLLDASAGGLHTLTESYLYTVEAFAAYLDHLTPGGYLSITRWLRLPPRDSLRLVTTAAEALARRGRPAADRIVVLRTWNAVTVLVKAEPLTAGEIAAVRDFAADRSFDTAWFPGISAEDANYYNQFDRAYHHEAIAALLGPDRDDFVRRYKFHLSPTTDNRPYFHHFLKWSTLLELLAVRREGGAAMLDWGYLVLVASLVQAILFGLLLIVLPLARLRRGRVEPGASLTSVGAYFFLLGIAFLFLEIAFIQRITLFLGHPLYAVAVVLAAFLVFAGLGSAASTRLPSVGRAIAGIALLAIAYLVLLPPLFERAIALPDALKVMLSLIVLAPLAFLMGMPFPLGLRRLRERRPEWIPWAWGVNGWASVVSAILATLIAVHLGFRSVVLIAVLLYLAATRLSWIADRPG
jgi:spermidine synthase